MTGAGVVRTVGAVVLMLAAGVRSARAEWTFGAFLGNALTQSSSLTLTLPAAATSVTLSPIHYDGESLASPVYYGYRAGFFPVSGWFGVEGEFIHLKVIADTARTTGVAGTLHGSAVITTAPVSSVIEQFSISHGVNLVLVNAVARHSWSDRSGAARWILAGRAGAGASIPHPESTIGQQHFEHYEWGSLSLQAAAGAECRVTGALFLMGEYKLTRTVQDVTIAGGSARTPLVTHHFVAGVVVHVR